MLKESNENRIDLQDDDPSLLDLMLSFIYAKPYPVLPVENGKRAEEDIITDAKLYAMADKYDIPALKDAVAASFAELLYQISTSKKATPMAFLTELIPIVYEFTPDSDRQLRELLQVFFRSCPSTVIGRKSVMEYARDHTKFAYDMLVHSVKNNKAKLRYRYWCLSCSGYDVGDDEGRCKKCMGPLEET